MMIDQSDAGSCQTPTERKFARRYYVEYAVAVAFMLAIMAVAAPFADHGSGALKIVAALAPLLGIGAIGWTLVRFVQRLDELRRQMMVIAGAVTALGAAFFAMALGLLEVGGTTIQPLLLIPIMAAIFVISCAVLKRRYQ